MNRVNPITHKMYPVQEDYTKHSDFDGFFGKESISLKETISKFDFTYTPIHIFVKKE